MRPRVLICRCDHRGLIEPAKLKAICASFDAAGMSYAAVPDLCGLAARRDPSLKDFAGDEETLILACYPRAVKALFGLAGAPLEDGKAQLVNLREASEREVLTTLGIARAEPVAAGMSEAGAESGNGWIPWFPAIDYGRCTNCQQCLGFCLFGVYGLTPDGKVAVRNPESCKTNCPACARICPAVAIIFPKYESGAIAGAEITDESREKSRVQADLQAILGSDVYAALAKRRQKVQERQLLRADIAQAHRERQAHLEKADLVKPAPKEAATMNTPADGSGTNKVLGA